MYSRSFASLRMTRKGRLCRLRMLLEITRRLDVLLTGKLTLRHHIAILLDVPTFLPVTEHVTYISFLDALTMAHQLSLLAGKDFGKQVEQVLGTSLSETVLFVLVHTTDGTTEELHLAPHVVTLCTLIRMFENLLVTLQQRKQ